jgi:integrase
MAAPDYVAPIVGRTLAATAGGSIDERADSDGGRGDRSEKSKRTLALASGSRPSCSITGRGPRSRRRREGVLQPADGRAARSEALRGDAPARARAGEDTDYVRPFHDGRHTSITNAAAAGVSPAALMARAGHSDFATTQLYIDLAGETFREEADRLEERVFATMPKEVSDNCSRIGDP